MFLGGKVDRDSCKKKRCFVGNLISHVISKFSGVFFVGKCNSIGFSHLLCVDSGMNAKAEVAC